jgi:hypothetical protein
MGHQKPKPQLGHVRWHTEHVTWHLRSQSFGCIAPLANSIDGHKENNAIANEAMKQLMTQLISNYRQGVSIHQFVDASKHMQRN